MQELSHTVLPSDKIWQVIVKFCEMGTNPAPYTTSYTFNYPRKVLKQLQINMQRKIYI